MAIVRVIPAGDVELVLQENGKRGVPLVSGKLKTRTKLQQKLKFFLGESFVDTREGVPYYREVFVKNPDVDVIRSLYSKVILSEPEVTRVANLNVTYDHVARRAAVEFDAFLAGGDVISVRQPDPAFIIDFTRTAAE